MTYTQTEVNSFDQYSWRSERHQLYSRIEQFCQNNNLDFTSKLSEDYIKNSSCEHIVYMLLFDRIFDDEECRKLDRVCQKHGRRLSIITDNVPTGTVFNLVKIYFYPELLGITASYNDSALPNPNPTRLYNCFIQRTDSVRQSWFYFLHNNRLLEKGYVSFLLNQTNECVELFGTELFVHNHTEFALNQLSHFDKAYHELLDQVPYRNFEELGNLVPLILDSKYSLILETCATDESGPWSITEKSLRSLQYPTIPLIFGAKKVMQVLKSLGFNFAIDLDYIDDLLWPERQQELLQILVNDSIDFNYQDLYNQSMHNRELLQTWKTEYQRDNFFDKFYTEVLEH